MYDEDESIYDLIAQVQPGKEASQRYKSKHNHQVPPSFSTFGFHGTSKVCGNVAGEKEEKHDGTHPSKKSGATFGRSVGQSVNPKQFLKKTEGLRPDPTKEKFEKTKVQAAKPAVPSRHDKPVMGLSTDKNFVVANAVEAILAVPKKGPSVETRAVDKGTYGKVPNYIERTKRELEAKYVANASASASQGGNGAAVDAQLQQLSPEEVQELKGGLKARYDALHKQFAGLSFDLETPSQLRRKEALERDLQKIELAMSRLGNKKNIFVCEA